MPQETRNGATTANGVTFLDAESVIFELKVPRETEESPEAAAQFFANLTRLINHSLFNKILGKKQHTIAVEIAAIDQTIHYYLICPKSQASYLESQLKAQYPLIVLLPAPDYLAQVWRIPGGFDTGQVVLGAYPMYPIKTYRDFKEVDPLIAVLSVMSRAHPGETMVVQYVLGPRFDSFRKRGYAFIAAAKGEGENKKPAAVADELALAQIKQKLAEVTMRCGIRLFTHAATKQRASEMLSELSGSFGGFANGDGNYLKFSRPSSLIKKGFLLSIPTRQFKYVPRMQGFSVSELATLWHMPNIKFGGVPSISWSRAVGSESPENLPTATSIDHDEINYFGRTNHKGEEITFGIKRNDRRRHVYIIGKSGTGKSTLIANMAINDIRNREGMAIIDPHGDLVESILDYIPSYRVNDIVYLDPSNAERGFVINPLEISSPDQKELVVSSTLGIFAKIYGPVSWGPRLEYVLRNALFALADIPNATLAQIPALLADKKWREENIQYIKDPVVKDFWVHEFAGMTDKMQAEAIGPILNKVGQFLTSPIMRNIISQPHSTIDLEDIMNSGKIMLLNLSQGRLGEDNAALLGAMLITKLQLAAMNRVNIPEAERKDFFLYVDEFQNFATNSFVKILSEARKYRLNLTLANQYTAQVPPEVLEGIYGNCGTIISFLVGSADAARLMKEFDSVYKDSDFTSLANFRVLLKLMIDSMASRPFAAATLPLPRSVTQNREKAIRVSAEKYTKTFEAIKEVSVSFPIISQRSSDRRPERNFANRDNREKNRDHDRHDSRPQSNRNSYDRHYNDSDRREKDYQQAKSGDNPDNRNKQQRQENPQQPHDSQGDKPQQYPAPVIQSKKPPLPQLLQTVPKPIIDEEYIPHPLPTKQKPPSVAGPVPTTDQQFSQGASQAFGLQSAQTGTGVDNPGSHKRKRKRNRHRGGHGQGSQPQAQPPQSSR